MLLLGYRVNINVHLLLLGHEERLTLHSVIMHNRSLIVMHMGLCDPPPYPYPVIAMQERRETVVSANKRVGKGIQEKLGKEIKVGKR